LDETAAVVAVSADGSIMRRVKRSNCSAIALLPLSATGTRLVLNEDYREKLRHLGL
jgi:hypothetical protein